jgi:hypothetical protein
MTAEHKAKVQECLSILQKAQGMVNETAAALCSVPGFAEEWDELTEAYDVIKKHWHKIASRRTGLLAKAAKGSTC